MTQLLQTARPAHERAGSADMAMRSLSRLTRMVLDILDMSRIEAGALDFLRQEFRVDELARSVAELLDMPSERNVPLFCRIDPCTPKTLVGDEARIRQILFNLTANALAFTGRDSVTLEIFPVPSPEVDGLRVVFSVHDTGADIREDVRRILLDPSAQAGTLRGPARRKGGLGLSAVTRLVALMGGHVVLGAQAGKRASAHVVLPFAPWTPRPGQCDAQPAAAPGPLPTMRVLLVEDDDANSFCMRKLLEKVGVRSVTAKNGLEAIDLWESEDFDCILMDVRMPVMDGVEATRRIRASQTGAKARIPIVALTACAMTGDRERFLEAGMDVYLSKPVQLADLTQAIKAACRKR